MWTWWRILHKTQLLPTLVCKLYEAYFSKTQLLPILTLQILYEADLKTKQKQQNSSRLSWCKLDAEHLTKHNFSQLSIWRSVCPKHNFSKRLPCQLYEAHFTRHDFSQLAPCKLYKAYFAKHNFFQLPLHRIYNEYSIYCLSFHGVKFTKRPLQNTTQSVSACRVSFAQNWVKFTDEGWEKLCFEDNFIPHFAASSVFD